ncbi:MAG: tetratricopeptide repeat protein [Defluviicoccus sp.]|nr:tetratricopeptide repeat protein [Defluviicoccus sp.]MDE0279139.1 tetratricopeptide repeat protein [Defluviicoccus sp.]
MEYFTVQVLSDTSDSADHAAAVVQGDGAGPRETPPGEAYVNDIAMGAPEQPAIRKFNPGTLQSDEEVIGQFVVRERELDIALEVLHGNIHSPSCQHVLLVAPRGRGKTMLLARIAAALRTDETLSEYLLPIRFMEESQEIFDIADFWLEALFHLAGESARCDPALSRELRETHQDLRTGQRGGPLAERARAVVLETAHRLGKKLVLMVENLQSLCEDVDADFGWQLREVLQSDPQIVLLGSATSRFEGLDDATQPFFEMFRIVDLAPLTTEECRRLWRAVGGNAVSGRAIRPIEILTGGSPRLLVIVAGFARHRSLLRLMEELVALIDDHTEYFRGHLEVIPKTERRVYLAVIDLWRPSGSGEIAARSRLDVRTVSTMLGRLVHRGAVIVEGSGKKRRYAAAERLYSIYYKLRRERDEAAVIHNLIRFMAVSYSEEELEDLSGELIAEAAGSPALREGFLRTLRELPRDSGSSRGGWLVIQRMSRQVAAFSEGIVERFPADGETEETVEAAKRLLKAVAQGELNKSDAAIAACEEVIELFGDSGSERLLTEVAKALYNKGVVQGMAGALAEAIATYADLVERFGDSEVEEIRATAAKALVNWGAAEQQTGDFLAAISTCDTVIERFGISDAPELQVLIAHALVNKGEAQVRIGEFEPAIALYDQVVERFGDEAAPDLRKQVAKASIGRGRIKWLLGEAGAAIAACDEAVERVGETDAPELRTEIAEALCVKGAIQGQIGHSGAAISTCDAVVARFGGDDAPEVRAQVAMALVHRAVAQLQAGDSGAVNSTCDEVVERFGDSDVIEMRIPVALALTFKGAMQGIHGDSTAAIATCEDAVERFGNSDAPELRTLVAAALAVKASIQGVRGDTKAAIATCDELARRFQHSDALELRALVGAVSTIKKVVHGTLGASEAVIEICDQVIDLFGEQETREIRALVAAALTVSRAMKGEIGEPEAVIAICGNLLELLSADNVPEPHALVSAILLIKGVTQGDLGEPEAAIATFDGMVRRFGDSDVPEIQALVAKALVCRGERQIEVGYALDALLTCDELDRRFDAPSGRHEHVIEWQTGWLRTQALLLQDRRHAAMEAFRSVYAAFVPGDDTMMRRMLAGVPELIATGASERELVEILTGDEEKSGTLLPLVVALRECIGEVVRAPIEVIDVATDIGERIRAKVGAGNISSSGAAPT